MEKRRHTGWRRLWAATGYSLKGLGSAWMTETAFRQELLLVLLLTPLAFWIGSTPIQWALLIFSLLLVMITELLNSAIETVVDRIGSEYNELSGRAKNLGSAAVMVALIAAGWVWGLVAWQKWCV